MKPPTTAHLLVLLAVAICEWSLLFSAHYPVLVGASDARSVLSGVANILTTILAISVSLLIVSLQFVSQAYTPRMLRTLFADKIFLGYLLAYTTAIFVISGEVAMNFIPPQAFLVEAYGMLLFCVTYLLVLLFHLPTTIHPTMVMNRMTQSARKDFCMQLIQRAKSGHFVLGSDDEPFLAMEQMMLKSIVENDFPTFLEGLKYFESLLTDFLASVKRELDKEQKSELRELPSPVFRYFLRIYRQWASDAIAKGRELHMAYLCESLRRLMTLLHELRAFRSFEWTSELYDYCGERSLEEHLLTFEEEYCRNGLPLLVETQEKILDEPLYFEDIAGYTRSSEEERALRADRHNLYYDFRNRLTFVSKLAAKASVTNLVSIVDSCMIILVAVLDRTLSLNSLERKRIILTTLVLPMLLETHKKCVDHGLNSTQSTTALLHYKIQDMKEQGTLEFATSVASVYAEMGLYSVQNGFDEEIYEWTVNARSLIKDFPEIAQIAIGVIIGAIEILSGKGDEESKSQFVRACKELEELKTWENHGNQLIIDGINAALAKFAPSAS